jgi:hypothetical protein
LESAKAAMEVASREVLESARADLQESVRIAAEAAAKPAAETAARAVAEGKTSDQTAMTATATPERPVRTVWAATPVLLPWLAAVTLGVLYLLTRNYF